jgi:hypothetical protein
MNKKCRTCRIFVAVTLIMVISISVADKYLVIPAGASTRCNGPNEVISGGGRCWMNRNLGAIQVATSLSDSNAYGDLYQWGRRGEGHQNRTSPTTTVLSSYDVSWYRAFVKTSEEPHDWRNPQNHKLWQGLGGINNPCPQGFRLPTAYEWSVEIASWGSKDPDGAFESPLKLVLAGYRGYSSASIRNSGLEGYYWSSSVDGGESLYLIIAGDYAVVSAVDGSRAYGQSIRCIKD